mmetsp:Transcript_146359/g.469542  ORF Transcript_146359/g.469542 Transcript_146359/m.469542 type:complete len:408 (-) Transcript_146359:1477-2700(-)
MLAQVNDLRAAKLRQHAVDLREARVGSHDLTAVAGALHSLGQGHRRARVAPAARHLVLRHRFRAARVHAHPHAEPVPDTVRALLGVGMLQRCRRPFQRHELGLHLQAEAHGVQGVMEAHLEGVPLGGHLVAVVLCEDLADRGVVHLQCLFHCLGTGFPQGRRTLDVREDHGNLVGAHGRRARGLLPRVRARMPAPDLDVGPASDGKAALGLRGRVGALLPEVPHHHLGKRVLFAVGAQAREPSVAVALLDGGRLGARVRTAVQVHARVLALVVVEAHGIRLGALEHRPSRGGHCAVHLGRGHTLLVGDELQGAIELLEVDAALSPRHDLREDEVHIRGGQDAIHQVGVLAQLHKLFAAHVWPRPRIGSEGVLHGAAELLRAARRAAQRRPEAARRRRAPPCRRRRRG